MTTKTVSRRSFLKLTGLVGGAFLLTSCEFSDRLMGVSDTPLPQIADAWKLTGSTLTLDLAKLPEIADLGGAVRIEGDALADPLLVIQGEDGNYYAFKNACTHAGRKIDMVAGTMTLECCSVSSSTFDYEGNVLSGPAKEGLTSYALTVDGEMLTIEL